MDNPFKGLPKPAIYAVLVGGVAVSGYALYQHHKTSGSWSPFATGTSGSSSTTSTTQTDPVTGLPYSQDDAVDPVTGLMYLAEAQQYGSVQAAEADVSQFGQSTTSGSGIGVQPATYPVANSPSGTQTGSPYTSNAAWAQAAQAGLTDIGYDGPTVAAALGAYLTQTPLTSAQAVIVNTAIGEFGPPPVGNLQVILQPTSGPGQTGGGSSPTIKPGIPTLSVTPSTGFADFGWSNVTGATEYELTVKGAGGKGTGTSNVDETLTGNHAEHVTLAKGDYVAQVRAHNAGGYSSWSPIKHFTVK
jgi:hypothetical protein